MRRYLPLFASGPHRRRGPAQSYHESRRHRSIRQGSIPHTLSPNPSYIFSLISRVTTSYASPNIPTPPIPRCQNGLLVDVNAGEHSTTWTYSTLRADIRPTTAASYLPPFLSSSASSSQVPSLGPLPARLSSMEIPVLGSGLGRAFAERIGVQGKHAEKEDTAQLGTPREACWRWAQPAPRELWGSLSSHVRGKSSRERLCWCTLRREDFGVDGVSDCEGAPWCKILSLQSGVGVPRRAAIVRPLGMGACPLRPEWMGGEGEGVGHDGWGWGGRRPSTQSG